MRAQKVCALMMVLLLLLCSCEETLVGRGNEELALDIRTEFLAMASCSATMEVTADYGQRVYEYTMDMTYEKGKETVLTVTAPEHIAGVTARIADGTALMEYDGASVETGPLDAEGLSPVGAVPALINAVCQSYIAETVVETLGEIEHLRVLYRDPEAQQGTGTELTVWFHPETHALVQGEISSDGAMVIRCVFLSFQILGQ